MARAEHPSTAGDVTDTGLMSPFRAFVVIVSLLVAATTVFFITRDDIDDNVELSKRSDNFALTQEEAIGRFKELRRLAFQAVELRDASLLSRALVPGTAIERRTSREIAELIRDRVVDLTRYEVVKTDVVRNEADEIRVLETARLYPCFQTESGRDVTDSPRTVGGTTLWILKQHDSSWLISEALIKRDRVVDRHDAAC